MNKLWHTAVDEKNYANYTMVQACDAQVKTKKKKKTESKEKHCGMWYVHPM